MAKESGPNNSLDKKSWAQLMEKTVMPFGFDIPNSKVFEGRITSANFLDTSLFSLVSGTHAAELTQEHVQTSISHSSVAAPKWSPVNSLHILRMHPFRSKDPGTTIH